MESGKSAPYHQWIADIVKELGLFDLVDIPPAWKQIFTSLPEYLETLKPVDNELIWLFEGTGDSLADWFFQFSKIKERLIERIAKFDPQQLMPFIRWVHSLELQLIERFDKKTVPPVIMNTSSSTGEINMFLKKVAEETWKTLFFHMLDMLPLGAVLFSSKGKALFFNKSMTKLTGFKMSSLQSIEDIRNVIADEEQSIKIYKYFQRALNGEELEHIVLTLKTEEGKLARFHLHTFSCPQDSFMTLLLPEHCHAEQEDQSDSQKTDMELKRCVKELKVAEERAQQCKEQLNNSYKIIERITWLLKEDIDSFHSYTALLEQEVTDCNEHVNDIGTVVQISATLDEMMENLMEFAQLSLGRIHFAPVELNGFLAAEEVFSQLEERLSSSSWKYRGMTIENKADSDIIVPLDFRIATEILWQLTVNALSYSEESILVKARVSDKGLVFEVIDKGPGIYETDLDRVFLPLVRLDHESGKGLGLGLAIVQQYTNLSGYNVELISLVGRGTTAKLVLSES